VERRHLVGGTQASCLRFWPARYRKRFSNLRHRHKRGHRARIFLGLQAAQPSVWWCEGPKLWSQLAQQV